MLVGLFACLFIRIIFLCCCKNFGMWRDDIHDFHFQNSLLLNCSVGFSKMDHNSTFFPIKALLTEVYMFVLLMCRVEKMGRGFGMRVPRFIQWQVNLAHLIKLLNLEGKSMGIIQFYCRLLQLWSFSCIFLFPDYILIKRGLVQSNWGFLVIFWCICFYWKFSFSFTCYIARAVWSSCLIESYELY